ncbi:hypothetical protein BP5796_02554 [Coleophoma crateriformis]|uniref:Uncharacterized protein n=1 Tax=Coleophoma crateriformis TaxID=565419 RepID=A0A3D8SYQ1_9HELO|nr:hypothetical protein BP5796_02554 [Coleophoma crateriformis]
MASDTAIEERTADAIDPDNSHITTPPANQSFNKRTHEDVLFSPSKRVRTNKRDGEEKTLIFSTACNDSTTDDNTKEDNSNDQANPPPHDEIFTEFQQEVRKQNRGEVNFELEQSLYDALQHQIREQLRHEVTTNITEGMKNRMRENAENAVRKELERRYMFVEAFHLKKLWDEKMGSQTRMVARIGRNGEQETVDDYFCDPSHRKAAVEIIRRCDPESEVVKACYAPKPQEALEFESPQLAPNSQSRKLLAVIVQLAETAPMTYDDAVSTMQEIELGNRQEIFRCIASHPYYIEAEKKQKHAIKMQLVYYMHRHFTSQISILTGAHIPEATRKLVYLQLGSDHVFLTKDDLRLALPSVLTKKNKELWAEITTPRTNKIRLRLNKNKKVIEDDDEE